MEIVEMLRGALIYLGMIEEQCFDGAYALTWK